MRVEGQPLTGATWRSKPTMRVRSSAGTAFPVVASVAKQNPRRRQSGLLRRKGSSQWQDWEAFLDRFQVGW